MADDFDRIKGNVQKMIDMKAPEADIDGYLQSEGLTADQFRQRATTPPQAEGPSALERLRAGVKHGAEVSARNIIEGATALPAMVGDAANALINLPIRGINAAAGTNIPTLKPASEGIQDLISPLDKPANMAERVISEPMKMMSGVPSSMAAAGASGVRALAPLAENLPQQMLSAFGAGAASGATREATDNPWVQMGATLAGGFSGGGLANRVERAGARANVPTAPQIKDAAKALYKQADNAGVIIKPEATQRLQQVITNDLAEFGYDPQLQPKIAPVLKSLERNAADNVTLKGLDITRRMANNARLSGDPSERAAAKMVIDRIDEFKTGLGAADVVQGDVDTAIPALQQGGRLWKQLRKAEQIDEAVGKADLRASSTGSGGNVDNATRQNIRAILDSKTKRAGFTKDELDLMEKIVRGTKTQNIARNIGKLSPQGSGLMSALGIGATAANPMLALVPGGGILAKALADRMTQANVQRLSDLIRAGGTKAALNNYVRPTVPTTSALPPTLLQSAITQRPGYATGIPAGGLLQMPLAPADTERRGRP